MTQRTLTNQEIRFANDAASALELLRTSLGRDEKFDCERLLTLMLTHKTSDGMPFFEPELTDDDAKERPWVMVRDSTSEQWCGPWLLAMTVNVIDHRFLTHRGTRWRYARRATPEEIAKAGLS